LAEAASVDDATPVEVDVTSTASIFFLITRETLTFEDIFVRFGLVLYLLLPSEKVFQFFGKIGSEPNRKKSTEKKAPIEKNKYIL
jgi:hypothetical protein